MSSAMVAIPLALATTSAFNGGLILEKKALARMPALSPRQPGRAIIGLLSSPAWLAGLALMLTGLAGQVIVLAIEPISLVQPVLAGGIAVTLMLSRLVLREQMGRAESACMAVLVASLIVLALSQDAARGVSAWRPGLVPMVALVGPSLAIGLLAAAWPWRVQSGGQRTTVTKNRGATALCAGLGTGLLYGVGSLATKGLSSAVVHSHGAASLGIGIVSSPYLYLLAVCSAAAMLLYQAALQACRASILIPVTNVVSSAYFVIAGTWLFHEPLPASPVKLALRLTGIAAAGVVLVILSVQAAGRPTSRSRRGSAASTPRAARHLAGLVLAALASFFAANAALPGWPIAGHSPQAPVNEYQTVTLTASGASYLSPTTLNEVTGARIQVTETIAGVASSGNSAIAVWNVYTATYDTVRHLQLEPKSRTLAFNRRTALLVNCCYENVNGNGLIRQTGVAGYAFPVGARKQTYQVFDDVLDSPEPFRYTGQGKLDGIPVYNFAESVSGAEAGYSLVSRDPERYTTYRVYSVDPETGAVLAVTEYEDLYLVRPVTGSPVTRLFDATLRTTPATVATLVRRDESIRHAIALAARIRVAFAALAGVLAVLAGFLLTGKRGSGFGRIRLAGLPVRQPDPDPAHEGPRPNGSKPSRIIENTSYIVLAWRASHVAAPTRDSGQRPLSGQSASASIAALLSQRDGGHPPNRGNCHVRYHGSWLQASGRHGYRDGQ
jgi:hypothetical protein